MTYPLTLLLAVLVRVIELVEFICKFPCKQHHGAVAVGALGMSPNHLLYLCWVDSKLRLGLLNIACEVEELRREPLALIHGEFGPENVHAIPYGFDAPDGKPATFAKLVERWKSAEGTALGENTLKKYCYALSAYIVPHFGEWTLDKVIREEIQKFFNDKAKEYSKPSLKSMRVPLSLTLEWAKHNNWIASNPAVNLRLPKKTAGRRIVRVVLTWKQIAAIMNELEEPYRTLVLFLALVPKRIEEAIALRPSDLDESNVLHIRRVMYERNLVELEQHECERIPLDSPVHSELVQRLRQLGKGHEWIFRSKSGAPVDPGNARRRKLHPAAKLVGLRLGGWHDFRLSFGTAMRRAGVQRKVRSAVLGHQKGTGVLADDVYDRASEAEIRQALVLGANWLWKEEEIQESLMSTQLCPQMCPEAHLLPDESASA